MAGAYGNKNAVGNKGGGRKSAIQERINTDFLVDLWHGKLDLKTLQKKIKRGNGYGMMHVVAVKCINGDTKMISKVMDKLFPNQQRIEQTTDLNTERAVQELNDIINNAKTAITDNTADDSDGSDELVAPLSV